RATSSRSSRPVTRARRRVRSRPRSVRPGSPTGRDTASVAIVGTFIPLDGGAPRPFTAYLNGEVKMEVDLVPRLVVEGESGTASVQVDPALHEDRARGVRRLIPSE